MLMIVVKDEWVHNSLDHSHPYQKSVIALSAQSIFHEHLFLPFQTIKSSKQAFNIILIWSH